MDDLKKQLTELTAAVQQATEKVGIPALTHELDRLHEQVVQADFWQDSVTAQAAMKRQATLEACIAPWQSLQKSLSELQELLSLGDSSMAEELMQQIQHVSETFEHLKDDLKFSGPYDDHNAIVSVFAGAGGTDAQDWAEMLLRMYVRWAEKHKMKVVTVEQTAADEAGIKSATIEVVGEFVYGKLKGEHGVHRLVRLSPFNADNLRQTSFAKVDILPKIESPTELEIDEKELKIDVYRSGGHGGQSVNTTDSAVRVTHVPTGITVAIQNERSQLQNKETALTILRSRLAQLQIEQHKERLGELKGPNQSAEWGNQIRSYVLHPYTMVKDSRTKYETSDAQGVLDGNIDEFVKAYLDFSLNTTA